METEKMTPIIDYIDELKLLSRSKNYYTRVGYVLPRFQYLIKKPILKTTEDDIKSHIQTLRSHSLKEPSIILQIGHLNRFFTFVVDSKKYGIMDNPVKRISKLLKHKNHQTRRPIKSVEEISNLIRGVHNPRDRSIIVLFAKTGIRCGELVALDIDDIDFDNGTVLVNKHIDDSARNTSIRGRKNGNESLIPLDDETIRSLKFYIASRTTNTQALFVSQTNKFNRLYIQDVEKIVKQWSIRTGIGLDSRDTDKKIVPHFFRAWNAYMLQLNGCNPAVIDAIRGDVAGSIRQFYVNQVMPFDVVKREYLRAVPQFGI